MAEALIRPAAVCYRLEEGTPKGDAVRQILRTRNVQIIEAGEKDLGQTIGDLVGVAGVAARATGAAKSAGAAGASRSGSASGSALGTTADIPADPFLLMCFFPKDLFDGFLADMRAAGVYIPHKGMLTPTNINWKLGDLIAEIRKEHAYMMNRNSLQKN